MTNRFFVGIAELESSNKSIIDCIREWCSREQIEIEMVAPLILKHLPLLSKVQMDAERLHFLLPVRRLAI